MSEILAEVLVIPNPALGVFFHWLGGLASASFYVPYRGVKRWSWETYWLVGGFFSWIIAPWLIAFFLTRDLLHVLAETPGSHYLLGHLFRVALGRRRVDVRPDHALSRVVAWAWRLCWACAPRLARLMPPIFSGVFVQPGSWNCVRAALFLVECSSACWELLAAGVAGIYKERTMSAEQKRAVIKEFDLKKGLLWRRCPA